MGDIEEIKTSIYPNGKIESRETYKNGFLVKREFFRQNGGIFSENNYLNGLKDGKQYCYYMGGSLSCVESFRKNLLHGHRYLFHPNGKTFIEEYYMNNVRHGIRKVYNYEGKLSSEIDFRDGIANGIAVQYFETGEKFRTTEINKGTIVSVTQYRKDGSAIFKCGLEETRSGICRKFDEKGNLVQLFELTREHTLFNTFQD